VRQRIGNLRRFRGRSFTIPAQAGQRYRVDLALSSRSRRFCERTDRGLWLDVWAPNPNPDVTEPAAVIERHCGGRAVFTARQTGSTS